MTQEEKPKLAAIEKAILGGTARRGGGALQGV